MTNPEEHERREAVQEGVRQGLKWVGLSMVFARLLRWLTNVALARLLAKEAFGIVVAASAAIQILGALREIGFAGAYVQREDADEEERRLAIDTVFMLTTLTNLALLALAWIATPWIAPEFSKVPERIETLTQVLYALFAVFLIESFATTPQAILQKRLSFAGLSIAEGLGQIANFVLAVVLALMGFGVWSLVAGQLGARMLQTLALMRFAQWWPRWRWDRRLAAELFAYGKHLWAFCVLSAAGQWADRLFVARYYGEAKTGAYGLAFNLCNLPSNVLHTIVGRVSFPALSRMQGDREGLRHAFEAALGQVSLLALPMAFGLLAIARDFVPVVYGQKWADAVPIVEILAFYGMALSLSSLGGPTLKAIGRPDQMFWTSVVHNLLLFGLLYALRHEGVHGIALAVLAPMSLSSILAFVLIRKNLELGWACLLLPVLRAGLCAFGMFLLVRLGMELLDGIPRSLRVLLSILVGALAYLGLTLLLNRSEFRRSLRAMGRS